MTVSRRQALIVLAAAATLGPLSLWLASTGASPAAHDKVFPVQKSDDEWQVALSADRYRILRGHGTERPFSSPLNAEKRSGVFVCAACGQKLFSSDTKFESGTGWPSFWSPLEGSIGTSNRPELANGADGGALQPVWRSPRSRLQRRTETHWTALLHQRPRAQFCNGVGSHLKWNGALQRTRPHLEE